MSKAIRDVLFKRAEYRWRSYTATGFFAKLGRLVFGGHAPTAIFLTEHTDADWHSMLCGGSVTGAWKQDESGCQEVKFEEAVPGEVCGHYWQNQLMRFHISPDGQRVLWNDIEGPQRGQLVVFSVRGSEAEPKLKVERTSLSL
jgi:hypothetical protein